MSEKGLAGLKVISFGTAIAGNVTAMTLAELGADVIKVEAPGRPDPLRVRIYPDLPRVVEPSGAETNIMFAGYSRSVRDVALDMKDPGDLDRFGRLLAVADVLVDNFATGVLDRWGLDAGRLRHLNPALVHVSVSGYGRTGPRAHHLAYGSNINAFLGLSRVWAPHGTQFDYTAVGHALIAVFAGLAHRDRTGGGVAVDLAQTEAGGALMAPLYLDYLVNGGAGWPGPNEVPGSPLSGVFACRGHDEWLAVELEDDEDWRLACALLGEPALAERWGEPAAVAGLRAAFASWCATRTPHQAMFAAQRAGLAAGAVHDSEDLYLDAQHRSRGFVVEVDHPDLGPLEYPAPIHRFGRTDVRVRRPSPRVGEHTAEVLRDWLGPHVAP
ncbi:CoA transferase [Actinoplanes sp. NPDC026619]|uniref:CaiB/BaiF CoA transferase family protein n=1 Tax=Actinoplanes sp. NPDC026619 TaxID=3155798 RepID=UPI0033F3FF2B